MYDGGMQTKRHGPRDNQKENTEEQLQDHRSIIKQQRIQHAKMRAKPFAG